MQKETVTRPVHWIHGSCEKMCRDRPSSFEEDVEEPAWVDAMVEEYDSIVRKNAWEIVPRLEGKSVVGSRWI